MISINQTTGIIGIGGIQNSGKTNYCIDLAMQLSNQDKTVIFFSYKESQYSLNDIVQKQLFNQTNIEFESIENFDYCLTSSELFMSLSKTRYDVIIIDDFELFYLELQDIEYIAKQLQCTFILSISLRIKLPETEYESISYWSNSIMQMPKLECFAYNNSLQYIYYCSEIYALHRPFQFGITEDEHGKSTKDVLEVYQLKNNSNSIKDSCIYKAILP